MRILVILRKSACLGGRGIKSFPFYATRTCVINGSLFGVVWASTVLPVSFDTVSWYGEAYRDICIAAHVDNQIRGMLCAILSHSRACNSARWKLAAVLRSGLSVADVHHRARGVLRAVLWCSCAGQAYRRSLAEAFGSSLSLANVDHPVRGAQCAVH